MKTVVFFMKKYNFIKIFFEKIKHGRFLSQTPCYNKIEGFNMNSKKYLIVLVLKILENDTDRLNPKTQTEIANEISRVYPCDRKTVGRNIKFLSQLGYTIVKTTKGFYMENKRFTMDEIKFVEEAILSSDKKSEEEKEQIRKKVTTLLNKSYNV